jgi:cytochrome c1
MRIAPKLLLLCTALAACGGGAGCSARHPTVGQQAFAVAGCGACHQIPGVPGAEGAVGPNLMGVGLRVYIAGVLPNTPANMALWISRPQSILPGNAMPDTGLSADQAGALASYLESLK